MCIKVSNILYYTYIIFYIGLGTSTSAEAKEYFSHLTTHQIGIHILLVLYYTIMLCYIYTFLYYYHISCHIIKHIMCINIIFKIYISLLSYTYIHSPYLSQLNFLPLFLPLPYYTRVRVG